MKGLGYVIRAPSDWDLSYIEAEPGPPNGPLMEPLWYLIVGI